MKLQAGDSETFPVILGLLTRWFNALTNSAVMLEPHSARVPPESTSTVLVAMLRSNLSTPEMLKGFQGKVQLCLWYRAHSKYGTRFQIP